MTQTILHSTGSDEWYTPSWLVSKVHEVIGYPDLDPATSEYAQQTVKAGCYLTKEMDGIGTPWPSHPCSVFLNPPSGGRGKKSLLKPFWNKLIAYRDSGLLVEAIFLGFSLEQLQTTQLGCTEPLANYPLCIPKRRVKFVSPAGDFNSPTHGQVIAYVPGTDDNTRKFVDVFTDIGMVLYPYTIKRNDG